MAKIELLDDLTRSGKTVIASKEDLAQRLADVDDQRVEIVVFTPAGAEAALELNENNRKLKQERVDKTTLTLTEGRFYLTNDAVTFDRNGVLVNGQHRLNSCVESQVPIEVILLTGVDPDTRKVIDTGAKRTLSDALIMSGMPYARGVAAAVALHYRYTHRQISLTGRGHAFRDRPTHDIMIQYMEEHPEIVEAAPEGMSTYLAVRAFHASAASTFIAVTKKIDADLSTEFIHKVKTGEGLALGDPALALRNLFMNVNNNAGAATGGKRRSEWSLAASLKAWNHTRRGIRVHILSVRTTEPYPEAI